jgi:hypothetical protein
MQITGKWMRSVVPEVILIFVFYLVSNTYLTFNNSHIGFADGKGYYDYLPAAFIHDDLNRKDWEEAKRKPYERIDQNVGIFVNANGRTLNKYAVGTAVMQAPFFAAAYLLSERTGDLNDGYQNAFQTAILIAALFYLFLSLIVVRKLFDIFKVHGFALRSVQFLLLFSTSLTLYTNAEASFSHVYSLFALTLFLYLTAKYFRSPSIRLFLLASAILGLVMLLRQVNLIVVFLVPFLAGSLVNLKQGFAFLWLKKWLLPSGLFLFLVVASFQMLIWYLQTGFWLVYSYEGESFNFASPAFVDILFSYKKGLYVYTPIAFLAVFGTFLWLKKETYLFLTWWLGFLGITYILSSWWAWYYGCSYGLRAYIEFYPFLMLPLGLLFSTKHPMRIPVIVLSLLTVPLNLIQTWQYNNYVLHWIDMDKEKYWKVFLRTSAPYQGLIWKTDQNLEGLKRAHNITFGDLKEGVITKPIPSIEGNTSLQITCTNGFHPDDASMLTIGIKEMNSADFIYWRQLPVIHLHEKELGTEHKGQYVLRLGELPTSDSLEISISLEPKGTASHLKDIRAVLFR